jgi:Retinoic acid induced 16-like protein
MVYLDLILRSVTEPGLLSIMIKFLLDEEKFDEQRIIDVLIERINSPDSRVRHYHKEPCELPGNLTVVITQCFFVSEQLCMVTLALFDTLLGLHNEPLMTDLVLKYLTSAPHIPIAQKHKINKIQAYAKTVDYFLDLAPDVMKNSNKILAEHNSMDYQQPASMPVLTASSQTNVSRTIGANWNHYGLHAGETLYSNYHAYLYDAHQKIKRTKQACDQWTENYFYKPPTKDKQRQNIVKMPNDQLVQMIRNFMTEFNVEPLEEPASAAANSSGKQLDSLQSIGESSGYESMKYRPDDDDESSSENSHQKSSDSGFSTMVNPSGANVTVVKTVEPWRISRYKEDQIIEMELTEDIFTQGAVSLGKFREL